MASSSVTPVRKTSRRSKPSLKALESLYISKLRNSGFVQVISSDEDYRYLSEEEEYLNVDIEKPKLLHDNEIVAGEEIFKFQSRRQRDALAQKVAETCVQKTPHVVRRKTRTKIQKLLEAEYEESGSEYEISSSASSSSESEDHSNERTQSSDEEPEPPKDKIKSLQNKVKFVDTQLQPARTKARGKYTINSDEYFANTASKKIQTSNNTLDKLETPRLPQYQLQKLLKNMKLSEKHEKAMKRLSEINESFFTKWLYLLNENFNILLYGLGSKKNILQSFQNQYLNDHPVIVVNGFFPTLSIKNILDGILIDLFELQDVPSNINEACELIIQELTSMPELRLYLIIHNIEGEMIKNSKSQNILARLAAVKNIHLIASIDHINAPLIWDHNKLSKFNYIWWDVTSFLPYLEETSFERSMMIQQSGTLALSSLRNVFLSLTTNSKSIYIIIVKHQLENSKKQYYQGLAFKDLYMACREAFIVSSDLALRAQLTEFVDHKMVKLKRSVEGTEYLTIPLANNLLQKFLDENS
ncbi:origin recognition complex subunit 2 [Anoplophora glabripennis]|uniref:origin recognition complex subunit 2 n=1 Tax=Anoplophora glabripennis TaxID=217634 RepID=UPI000873C424|nr:origin recognition complex subunit 2 [Anoplophora glabripennis]